MISSGMKAAMLLGTAMLLPSIAAPEGVPALAAGNHVLATQGGTPAAGTVFITTRTFSYDKLTMKVTGGRPMTGTIQRTDTVVERFEGLGPGKMRRTLDRSEVEGSVVINGQENRPPRKLDGLLETPVVVSREGGKWTAALEKGVAFENQRKDLARLEESLGRDPAFAAYGGAPRKPGDTWEAGLHAFCPEVFGEFADVKQVEGKFTVAFVGVKDFKGTPCARLKLTLDLKGRPKGAEEGGRITFRGEGDVLRSLRDQVDLAWKFTGAVRVSDPGDGSGQPAMQLEGPVAVSGTTEVKRR
jgi:hypothetical protein